MEESWFVIEQTGVQLGLVSAALARMKAMLLDLSFIANVTPLLYPLK